MNKKHGLVLLALLPVIFFSISRASFGSTQPDAKKLDEAIGKVIQKSEYQWRMPHRRSELPDRSFIGRAIETLNRYLMKAIAAVKRWIDALRRWFLKHGMRQTLPRGETGRASARAQRMLLIALSALIVAILLFGLWRIRKRKPDEPLIATPVIVVPDLNKEDIAADQLPEDGWQTLGTELAGRGELRLALRAFYMASLALLARSDLITIAKFKSNREYQRELYRRAHSYRSMLDCFSHNVDVFERSWYGEHPVSPEMLDHFIANQKTIRQSVRGEFANA